METLWLHGQETPENSQQIADRQGIFETFVWRQQPPVHWDLHAARWQKGQEFLGIQAPTLAELQPLLAPHMLETPTRVRLTLLKSGAILLGRRPMLESELEPRPWRLQTGPRLRDPTEKGLDVKKLALLDGLTLRAEAHARGADDVLILTLTGQWAETATANVLVGLHDGRTVTPGPQAGALTGTTLQAARKVLQIQDLPLDDALLPEVAWMLVCNAVIGFRVVTALDGHIFAPPPAEILTALASSL